MDLALVALCLVANSILMAVAATFYVKARRAEHHLEISKRMLKSAYDEIIELKGQIYG